MIDLTGLMTRRTTFSLLGLAGPAFAGSPAGVGARARRFTETRAVTIEWLVYSNAAGNELARIRPFAMLDFSDRPEVEPAAGERAFGVSITIRNTGDAPLVVPPSAFALWEPMGGSSGRRTSLPSRALITTFRGCVSSCTLRIPSRYAASALAGSPSASQTMPILRDSSSLRSRSASSSSPTSTGWRR